MALQLKRANALMHFQWMASIAPIVIGCIDYLAYWTFFTCAMFHPKIKLVFFFPPEKPQMSAATSRQGSSPAIWWEKINRQKFSRHYIINHLISYCRHWASRRWKRWSRSANVCRNESQNQLWPRNTPPMLSSILALVSLWCHLDMTSQGTTLPTS